MIIHKIHLINFKNFKGTHSFEFSNYNLISGENGVGKSTVALDSVLFALYGYSTQNLDKLPNKTVNPRKCSVTIEIDNLIITREIPVKLKIIEDGVEKEFATNREAQKYLNERYKNVEYFRKFRMIDITKGINILEQGNSALLETLFSYHQEYIASIREKLLEKKSERERLNIDNVRLYNMYPSQKRYDFLSSSLREIEGQFHEISTISNHHQNEYYKNLNLKKRKDEEKKQLSNQSTRVIKEAKCPLCRNILTKGEQSGITEDMKKKITQLTLESTSLIDKINDSLKEAQKVNCKKKALEAQKNRITSLKHKLETRLKQKEFIYRTKDIEVIKTAIKELDKFSNQYILKYIKILEPIINNVIKIIGFNVEFLVNDKKKIDIKLLKDNIEYDYYDLSSGQKLLLTVGFQLALLLEKSEEGIIIADEGFSSLSENNLNLLLDMLRDYPFQLVYVIHRSLSVPTSIKEIKL